ncbi:phage GP46 family protein [Pseudogulbenkiania ferrooxidans]|uniref:GP46 family protein n=1 Tax=Pseudogulbenkiania ferrooxidans 2002 TaxID=279714 RepID=B9Z2Z4_9NEIS|nr:phage GP46 family protein [Pseudogulbenkiania ferrooxidans]EEG08947.1 conserved hypothetical protein [Pseudogulbenkiania ferrooxidans 2002]
MDAFISPQTRDYDGTQVTSLENAVYLRLTTPRGSLWHDPTLGSRLHLLAREKDVARVRRLGEEYVREALQPLLDDGRALSLEVFGIRLERGFIAVYAQLTDANGNAVPLNAWVPVS